MTETVSDVPIIPEVPVTVLMVSTHAETSIFPDSVNGDSEEGFGSSEGYNPDMDTADFNGGGASAEVSPDHAMSVDVEIVANDGDSESSDRGVDCEDAVDENNDAAMSDNVETAAGGVFHESADMGTQDDLNGFALHDEQYRKLDKLIVEHQKELRTRKVLTSDSRATDKIFDLQALKRFNVRRHQLRQNLSRQVEKLNQAPAKIRPALKAKQRPIHPTKQASEEVAEALGKGNYYGRRLRDYANHLLRTGLIPENRQGQGATHETWLNKLEVRSSVQRFARGQIPFEEGGFAGQVSGISSRCKLKLNKCCCQLRPAKLCRYVNQFLFPSLGIESEISETTAVNWLKKIGFRLRKVRKGVYVDGHEREDVVKARREFISYLEQDIFP